MNKKEFFIGTHRVSPPEVTWKKVKKTLPTVGVTRVADVTYLDCLGIPVTQVIRPFSRNLSVHQGKGIDFVSSRVSAAMEAIELWHAESISNVPFTKLSIREMNYGNSIIDDQFRWLPDAIPSKTIPIKWFQATEILSSKNAWIPAQMLELDFTLKTHYEPPLFQKTSNGLASGNTKEEALLHSICELIERHALYLKAIEPERKTMLDISSIDSTYCEHIIELINSKNLKLGVFDITWEVDIPVFFVELVSEDLPIICNGSGCHTSSEVALLRALTEAAQSRITYIAGSRDDIIAPENPPFAPFVFESYQNENGCKFFEQVIDLCTDTIKGDLENILNRLQSHGYRVFYIDITKECIGIPVVITYIPGLMDDPHE